MIPIWRPHLTWCDTLAVVRCLRSGRFGTGPKVTELEEAVARLTGAKHCVAVNSGTTGLMLSFLALELSASCSVAAPDYGWPAAANAAHLLDYKVELLDVCKANCCLKVEQLTMSLRTEAVVFIGTWGHLPQESTAQQCRHAGVRLIEDACQAFGTPGAGRSGIVGVFSFSVPKIVTAGQGGAVITDDDDVATRLRQLVEHGGGDWKRTRLVEAVGGNFRMTDMQAALALSQLRRLDRLKVERERLYSWYGHGGIFVRPNASYATTTGGKPLADYLKARGVGAIAYHRPLHESPTFAGQGGAERFPGAMIAAETVVLPSWGVTRREVQLICSLVREWRSQNGYFDSSSDGRPL